MSKSIVLESVINAPIEKVWDFWTTPEHITQWNQASDDWHTPYAENDVKVGGKFKSTMAAKDGSMKFDFEGIYTAVEQKKLIQYKLADERTVKILFTERGGATMITEYFDAEEVNPIEVQRGGWQAILDSFKKYVEQN